VPVLPEVKKGDIWLIRRQDLDAWTVQKKRQPEAEGI
jgi:hypothetical protein